MLTHGTTGSPWGCFEISCLLAHTGGTLNSQDAAAAWVSVPMLPEAEKVKAHAPLPTGSGAAGSGGHPPTSPPNTPSSA